MNFCFWPSVCGFGSISNSFQSVSWAWPFSLGLLTRKWA
uniref:Uncharacterized protein n=1 Tax=Rhizophora mucronata TaxID=61149 RepID=A0A2P2NH88_RHIMU